MSPQGFTKNPNDLSASLLVVGISDMEVSKVPGAVLVTHSLGSCVGVTLYDPVALIGGMLHFQLPDSAYDKAKAEAHPSMFADTGISLLFSEALSLGALKSRLVVKLCGGSNIMDKQGIFNIGKRNHAAARKMLWRLGCFVTAEDVGGESWRTMTLHIKTGTVTVKSSTGQKNI